MPTPSCGFDQRGQRVFGPQYNVAGDLTIHYAGPRPIPLQRPPRTEPFVGREAELERLLADLQPGRVVTVCGPAGIGKSALAAEAVWRLAPADAPPERFPDGILLHEFRAQPQAAIALEGFVRSLGEDLRPSPTDAARRALASRCALLVLDGAEACDDLDTVLSVRGRCGVLISTRRRSDAPADSLNLDPLTHAQAVQLLQAWGRDCAGDAAAAGRICELLGGLPLAVFLVGRYLAARRQSAGEYVAWLEAAPMQALDLDGRAERSIAALLERSLEGLSVEARAALAVAGLLAPAPFPDVLTAIASLIPDARNNAALGELVEYGLLLRPDEWYQVAHALIHVYARNRLQPPARALEILALRYLEYVSQQTEAGPAGFALLDDHRAHILAVQAACLAGGRWRDAQLLAWAIDGYLSLRGHWTERVTALSAALSAARQGGDRLDEGAWLGLLGAAYAGLGQMPRAVDCLEQALPIHREVGDRQAEGVTLAQLGGAQRALGDARRASEYANQALAIFRAVKDPRREAAALELVGLAQQDLGRLSRAMKYFERAAAIAGKAGDLSGQASALGNLGNAYREEGDVGRAIQTHERALDLFRQTGDRPAEATTLGNLGLVYLDMGLLERAGEFFELHLAVAGEIGDRQGEANALTNLGLVCTRLGDRRRAGDYFERALAIARVIGDGRAEAVILHNLSLATDV